MMQELYRPVDLFDMDELAQQHRQGAALARAQTAQDPFGDLLDRRVDRFDDPPAFGSQKCLLGPFVVGRRHSFKEALLLQAIQDISDRCAVECNQLAQSRCVNAWIVGDRDQSRELDWCDILSLGLFHERSPSDLVRTSDEVSGLVQERLEQAYRPSGHRKDAESSGRRTPRP